MKKLAALFLVFGCQQNGLSLLDAGADLAEATRPPAMYPPPHLGDPIADIAENDLPGPLQDAVNAFLNILGTTIDQGQTTQNAQLALALCSTKGAQAFTAKYPDAPSVAYFSVAGRSNGVLGD